MTRNVTSTFSHRQLILALAALFCAAALVLVACGGEGGRHGGPLAEFVCADGIDNDHDGDADCTDGDCECIGICPCPEDCGDGIDNDGDGDIDCADTDCALDVACGAEVNCTDGVDNDADGPADCNDSDCAAHPTCVNVENCCDHIVSGVPVDEDGDGNANFADSDCSNANGDGDPVPNICDCAPADGTAYPGAAEACDGLDTDCDGNTPATEIDNDVDTYSECEGDCNDGNTNVHPGAAEACNGIDDDCSGSVPANEANVDGDAYRICAGDCDDADPAVNPGAQEICNGIDDDCDTKIDGADDSVVGSATWYVDADDDGYGDVTPSGTNPKIQCDQPTGYVLDSTDCNDGDDTIHPGATEDCDGVNQDCDLFTDEDCDDDLDDYCDDALTTVGTPAVCPNGGGDCDDDAIAVHPNATEVCNDVDDDCEGGVDEGCDDDDDDYCDAALTTVGTPNTCPNGGGDCNDTVDTTHPGATELCDDVNQDCDGSTDEGCDDDLDDYCDDQFTTIGTPPVCPNGDGDCNDAVITINPGADELCATAGVDDDCDGQFDEPGAVDGVLYYDDTDGDGYGATSDAGQTYCSNPGAGFSINNQDCDDGDPAVNPAAQEVCNTIDDDCDGDIDDADPSNQTNRWYRDQDNDGYGNPAVFQDQCAQPNNYVDNDDDCDDRPCCGNPIHPGATEVCDTVDNDCDGFIDAADDDVVGTTTYYQDLDGDGYGNPAVSQEACTQPAGYVANDDDCDDAVAAVNPGAQEVCNLIDDDCDGLIDADDPGAVAGTWYWDADVDGYGNPGVTQVSCAQPPGYVANDDDCDDGNTLINPGATEICDDVDNNCTAGVDEGCDDDDDAYCQAGITRVGTPATCTLGGNDCLDTNANVHPNATEVCNDLDDDCDGATDEDCDDDDDNYCDSAMTRVGTPTTCTVAGADCNDANAAINPGATEICNDVNDDCDAQTDEGCDDDGDDYCDSTMTRVGTPAVCPLGGNDCADTNVAVHPGIAEICNDTPDNNCDGLTNCQDAATCPPCTSCGSGQRKCANGSGTSPVGSCGVNAGQSGCP